MFTCDEAKKYFRFILRSIGRSIRKSEVESFAQSYDTLYHIASNNKDISSFVSYFSRADKSETTAFMKGGCGYFASLLDLYFGNENSGFLILSFGCKDREGIPEDFDSKNECEKLDFVGECCGFSHILYKHEGKYYDACGEYNSKEEVLEHCKEYYKEFIYRETKSGNLTGKYYLTEFVNGELWKTKKKDIIKQKGYVHYILGEHTSNLFDDIGEMFNTMRQNFGRDENRNVIFKYDSYVGYKGY